MDVSSLGWRGQGGGSFAVRQRRQVRRHAHGTAFIGLRTGRKEQAPLRASGQQGDGRGPFGLREPTEAEADAQLLRDMATASRIASDGVCAFVVLFCGLNWVAFRRARVAKERELEQEQEEMHGDDQKT